LRELTKKIKVYNKHGDYLAYFDSEPPSNPDNRINMMINPNVSVESNGASTFTFQISVYSRKWMDIFDPENKYIVDGREYICLNEDGIQIDDDLVSVTAYESWKLLEKKYVQAYNVPKEEEFIDDQTVCLLPKSTEPLVVNGVTYTNNPYPRGSAGYNLWALLQGSGWSLKFCDVIVDGFNPAEDYGVFNIETDQKDLLYNLEYVRELYGGIFEWDSINKTLSLHDSDKWDTNYGFEIRKGKNLQSLSIVHDNDIITRLYPLGEGNLNIAAVNGGKRYVDNFSYTNAIYERNLPNADIYDQKQLKFWGEKELAKLCKPRKNVTASIVDVRTVPGKEYETFDINDIATVVYTEGDQKKLVKEQLRIISWSYNVFAPYEMTLELGDKRKDAVDYLKQAYDAGNASDEIIDSNGDISIDCIWDSEYGGYFKDGVYDYITQTEHRLEIKIDDVEGSLADFIVEANETFATIDALVKFETETTTAIANLKMYADDTFATIESFVSFQTQTSQHFASITQYVDSVSSEVSIVAGEVDSQGQEIARISVRVNNVEGSVIDLEADVINLDGNITNINSKVTNINGRLNAAEGDIDSLSSRTATIEKAYITKAEVDSLVANKISALTISASKIYLNGHQCRACNVLRATHLTTHTGTFITKVTPIIKNGVVTGINKSTGSALTSVGLTNETMATVVGYY
jgi:hypothetical protein